MTKKTIEIILSVIILLTSSQLFSKVDTTKINQLKHDASLSVVQIPDKLNIVFPDSYFKTPKYTFKDFFPALATLIAGAITVFVNYRISKNLRESTSENVERQIKSTRENMEIQTSTAQKNIEIQINSAKQNIETQLTEAKLIKMAELRTSLNLKNRQEWMHDFRNTISEIISLVQLYCSMDTTQTVIEDVKRMLALNVRISLLLHPEREFEADALVYVNKLLILLSTHKDKRKANYMDEVRDANTTLTDLSRKILEKNWQKMNNTQI
jgi:hypothetical protein